MSTLFSLLALASGVAFLVGLVKPQLVKANNRKKSSLLYGGGWIAFTIAGGMALPEPVTRQSEQREQTEGEMQEQLEVYSVGNTINHKNWSVTIIGVDYRQQIGGEFAEEAEGKYAVIFATVENNTKETARLPGLFKLKDSKSRTFEELSNSISTAQYEAESISGQLPPGTQTKAMMVFDVAPDVKSPTLLWKPTMSPNKYYKIKL